MYLLNKRFKFQTYAWNKCHDLYDVYELKLKILIVVVLLVELAKVKL